ncbi:hypothetical protein HMPREF3191_01460 [Veillonellaceae bacterium DNF00626]|nr:hypothetical protein HMPREF3191_01460 [Veillonellaceae bacterium DNF00626]
MYQLKIHKLLTSKYKIYCIFIPLYISISISSTPKKGGVLFPLLFLQQTLFQ